MKDGEFYVTGRDIDKLDRLKRKAKDGTGHEGDECTELASMIKKGDLAAMTQVRHHDPQSAAVHEEHWKSPIV